MAARINRRHSDEIRQKIQASVLVTRLHQHAMGELDMTPTQVKAAETLLDRSVPKLQSIQHSGDNEHPVDIRFSWQQN